MWLCFLVKFSAACWEKQTIYIFNFSAIWLNLQSLLGAPSLNVYLFVLVSQYLQTVSNENKANEIQFKQKLFQPHPQPDGTLKQSGQPRPWWGGQADFESERSALTSVYFHISSIAGLCGACSDRAGSLHPDCNWRLHLDHLHPRLLWRPQRVPRPPHCLWHLSDHHIPSSGLSSLDFLLNYLFHCVLSVIMNFPQIAAILLCTLYKPQADHHTKAFLKVIALHWGDFFCQFWETHSSVLGVGERLKIQKKTNSVWRMCYFFREFVAQTLLFFLTFPLLTFLEEGILSSHIVCAWEGATGVFAWLNTWVMATTAQRSMTGPTPKKRYSYWTYFNGDFLGTSEGAKERYENSQHLLSRDCFFATKNPWC